MVKNKDTEGNNLMNKFYNLKIRFGQSDAVNYITEDNIYSEKNVAFEVDGDKDNWGEIISVTKSVKNMLDFQPEDLVSKNIATIMPDYFKKRHPKFVSKFYETGKGRFINNSNIFYFRHRQGHIVIGLSNIRIIHTKYDEVRFFGLIRPIFDGKEIVLVDKNGNIKGLTNGIVKDLHLSMEKVQKLKIFDICKNYEKVFFAFSKNYDEKTMRTHFYRNKNHSSPDTIKEIETLSVIPRSFEKIYEQYSMDGGILNFKISNIGINSKNEDLIYVPYHAILKNDTYGQKSILTILTLKRVDGDFENKSNTNINTLTQINIRTKKENTSIFFNKLESEETQNQMMEITTNLRDDPKFQNISKISSHHSIKKSHTIPHITINNTEKDEDAPLKVQTTFLNQYYKDNLSESLDEMNDIDIKINDNK